jgi:hypothetical protein
MTLSVCFVTRNHADCLPAALAAARPAADEVVVLDTGSTDTTAAVAEQAGARVIPFPWADDFAAACNAALDHATGEWVLWLNPDERLDPLAPRVIRRGIALNAAFAYILPVQTELREGRTGFGPVEPQLRLFRRVPAVRYRGRLHPHFDPPLEDIAGARGQSVGRLDAVVRRHAYLSPVTPEKVRWTNRLIEAELRDRPGQLALQIELGRNMLSLNDPRGHDILGEAAGAIAAVATGPRPAVGNLGSLFEYLLTVSPAECRGPIDRAEASALAERWLPHSPPVVWARAAERTAAGDYATAVRLLESLLEMGRTGRYDRSPGFHPDILGPAALLNLAQIRAKTGATGQVDALLIPLLTNPDYRDRATAIFQHLRTK